MNIEIPVDLLSEDNCVSLVPILAEMKNATLTDIDVDVVVAKLEEGDGETLADKVAVVVEAHWLTFRLISELRHFSAH